MNRRKIQKETKHKSRFPFFLSLAATGVLTASLILTGVGLSGARTREWIDISSPEEWEQYLVDEDSPDYDLGGRYRLTGDLDLTGASGSIGTNYHPFTGSVDGGGHIIEGLDHPMFGVTKGARIENLLVDQCSIRYPHTYYDGEDVVDGYAALIAYAIDTEVKACGTVGDMYIAAPFQTTLVLDSDYAAKATPSEASRATSSNAESEELSIVEDTLVPLSHRPVGALRIRRNGLIYAMGRIEPDFTTGSSFSGGSASDNGGDQTTEPEQTESPDTEDNEKPDEKPEAVIPPQDEENEESQPANEGDEEDKSDTAETDTAETSPAETAPTETSPTETSPTETSPTETSPAETEPAETSPAETLPADSATEPEIETKPEAETEETEETEEEAEDDAYYIEATAQQIVAGGLIAQTNGKCLITECFSFMNIGEENTETTLEAKILSAGFCGRIGSDTRVESSYASGLVDVSGISAGFVGANAGKLQDCYTTCIMGEHCEEAYAFAGKNLETEELLSGCIYDRQVACAKDGKATGQDTMRIIEGESGLTGESWHYTEHAYPQLTYFVNHENETFRLRSGASAIALVLPENMLLSEVLKAAETDFILPTEIDGAQINWSAEGVISITEDNRAVFRATPSDAVEEHTPEEETSNETQK